MPPSPLRQFEGLARRIMRRRHAAALLAAFASIVSAMAALVAVDWSLGLWRFAARLTISIAFFLAAIAIFRRARSARGAPVTPLQAALQVESLYPEHGGLLTSAVEFSRQDDADPTAGSADLRRAVVLRAAVAAESLDLAAVTPRSPLRRAAGAAIVAGALLALIAIIWPRGLAAGVARLANPFSDAEYPRRHHLDFADPPRTMAIGDDFHAVLRDQQGRLPEVVHVEYRVQSPQGPQRHTQQYRAGGESVAVAWPNVQAPFDYRAYGGDHRTMPWRHVKVATAPRITSLQATIHPPQYMGLAPHDAEEPLRIPAGSAIALRGETDLQIAAAELLFADQRLPLAVGEDGLSFRTQAEPWRPQRSGRAAIVLRTPAGLSTTAARGLPIELRPDRPPTVRISQPTGSLAVLPEAAVDVLLTADDDLAVRMIGLELRAPGESGDARRSWELYRGPAKPAAGTREASHLLELSALALRPGQTATVHGVAEDYAGRRGRSERPLELRIVSREEFVRRLDSLQSQLLKVLQQAADRQRSAIEQVDSWRQAPQAPPLAEVQSGLDDQRAAAAALAAGPQSALQLSAELVEQYQRNRWSDVAAAARLADLCQRLQQLADDDLAAAESLLNRFAASVETAESAAPRPNALASPQLETLAKLQEHQSRVQAALDEALQQFANWSQVQQFQRDLVDLATRQAALSEETHSLARDALENPGGDAQRRRRTDLAATQQRRLAGELSAALDQARQSADRLATTAPEEAARLQAAAASGELGEAPTAAARAAEQLANEQFGQAADSQQKTAQELQKMLDQLDQGRGPLDRLDAALKRLVAQQGAIVAELDLLQAAAAGQHMGGDDPSPMQLARRQSVVRSHALAQAEESGKFPLFARRLRLAASTMGQVETRLASVGADRPAADLARQAHAALRQLAEAVHDQGRERLSPNEPGDAQRGGSPKENISPEQLQAVQLTVAQLALLRALQADLQRRTAELEQAADQLDEARRAEQGASLAAEQRELQQMTTDLMHAAAALPVANPPSRTQP